MTPADASAEAVAAQAAAAAAIAAAHADDGEGGGGFHTRRLFTGGDALVLLGRGKVEGRDEGEAAASGDASGGAGAAGASASVSIGAAAVRPGSASDIPPALTRSLALVDLHPHTPAYSAAMARHLRALAAAGPIDGRAEVEKSLQLFLLLLGVGPDARVLLARRWYDMTRGIAETYLGPMLQAQSPLQSQAHSGSSAAVTAPAAAAASGSAAAAGRGAPATAAAAAATSPAAPLPRPLPALSLPPMPLQLTRIPIAVTTAVGAPVVLPNTLASAASGGGGIAVPLSATASSSAAGRAGEASTSIIAVHGSDGLERPPAFATDFEVAAEVAVAPGDTLASLRERVTEALRDADLPVLHGVTVLVPDARTGRLPRWCPSPRPSYLRMSAHWDYLDLCRGGRVVFRDGEPSLAPWDIGPLIVIRVHQIAWQEGGVDASVADASVAGGAAGSFSVRPQVQVQLATEAPISAAMAAAIGSLALPRQLEGSAGGTGAGLGGDREDARSAGSASATPSRPTTR